MFKKIPAQLILFSKLFIAAIAVFSLFRFILFLTETNRIGDSGLSDILYAFFMGLRFDIVISGYILFLPFLLISIIYLIIGRNKTSLAFIAVSRYFIISAFSLSFLVCAADIPYFNQFFARFSISAFQWVNSPGFVLGMIIQEPRYWIFIIPFIVLLLFFIRLANHFFGTFNSTDTQIKPAVNALASLLFLLLMLIGIRGRVDEKSPIRIGTAYFCNNPFLNQLGLNPNFTFIRSFLDANKAENQNIHLIEEQLAIRNVQSYLNISDPNPEYPLLRKQPSDSTSQKNYNVVLIIMESMSASKMTRHGNTESLTPFLDSISHKGYYFENAYTTGIHTMNGIFSTLFSYPAIFRQHPMKESSMQKYNGIFSTLKEKGYSSVYFTTHDGQFDNVEGFLKANDCERVVTKSDYPPAEIKTTLGVPDDYMFRYSIPVLNELSKKGKPFIASFMTASDHGPYYIPEYFKPHSSDIKKQVSEYADYSLRKFIEAASDQEWFPNTIFVFIADHGAAMDNLYELSISYHHTPLLFYAPKLITNYTKFDNIASQTDVFPSLMGLLQIPYYNNTLGIDLFKEHRDYAILNADDKFGVINNNWLLIEKSDKSRHLYKHNEKSTVDYASVYPDTVEIMSTYAKSNLQVFQYLKNTNKLFAPVKEQGKSGAGGSRTRVQTRNS